VALSGNLRDFSLPDVFQLISFSHKTGTLAIDRGDAKGYVYFREGDVFFAISNWNREPMGRRLVRAGKITERQLQRALEVQASDEDPKRLGEILVKEGFLNQKVLETFVQEQIQDTIFDLFRWEEGDFDFKAGVIPGEEDIGLSVSVENIIMEGSRRLEEWDRIRKKIPTEECIFRMAVAPGEGTFEVSLKPSEWKLLCLLDGRRTVAELSHLLDLSDFQVSRVLYGMFSGGLLERVDSAGVEEASLDAVEVEVAARVDLAAEAEARQEEPEARPEEATPRETEVAGPAEEPIEEVPQGAPTDEIATAEAIPSHETEGPPGEGAQQEGLEAELEAAVEPDDLEVEEPLLEGLLEGQAAEELPRGSEQDQSQTAAEIEEDVELIAEAATTVSEDGIPEGVETVETDSLGAELAAMVDEDELDAGDVDLTDELAALTGTGAAKPRPGARQKPSLKAAEDRLQVDGHVSKELVLKIIGGIEKL